MSEVNLVRAYIEQLLKPPVSRMEEILYELKKISKQLSEILTILYTAPPEEVTEAYPKTFHFTVGSLKQLFISERVKIKGFTLCSNNDATLTFSFGADPKISVRVPSGAPVLMNLIGLAPEGGPVYLSSDTAADVVVTLFYTRIV
ncbi:hypothetical protein [Thermofilum sp.]|uniref:hypothetical protein n=1 Tax=Thermofilum sp. TaxID=1961369 RepID=UPI003170B86D